MEKRGWLSGRVPLSLWEWGSPEPDTGSAPQTEGGPEPLTGTGVSSLCWVIQSHPPGSAKTNK